MVIYYVVLAHLWRLMRRMATYMRKRSCVAVMVYFGKKNWRKIWPKNGLKLQKFGLKMAKKCLKWAKIS